MHTLLILLHSWTRWAAILLALTACLGGLRGLLTGTPWSPGSRRINLLAATAFDVQLVLGLALYLFFSPFTIEAFRDFGFAMRTPSLRYWAVEHVTIMLVALILAHAGNVAARRARADRARHLRSALLFGAVVLLALAGTPWPGLANGRPLFRIGF